MLDFAAVFAPVTAFARAMLFVTVASSVVALAAGYLHREQMLMAGSRRREAGQSAKRTASLVFTLCMAFSAAAFYVLIRYFAFSPD